MAEIESLKERIKSLEEQAKGLELALLTLAIAVCAEGEIDIPGVAKNFKKVSETMKSVYGLEEGGAKTAEPVDKLLRMLEATSAPIEEHQRNA